MGEDIKSVISPILAKPKGHFSKSSFTDSGNSLCFYQSRCWCHRNASRPMYSLRWVRSIPKPSYLSLHFFFVKLISHGGYPYAQGGIAPWYYRQENRHDAATLDGTEGYALTTGFSMMSLLWEPILKVGSFFCVLASDISLHNLPNDYFLKNAHPCTPFAHPWPKFNRHLVILCSDTPVPKMTKSLKAHISRTFGDCTQRWDCIKYGKMIFDKMTNLIQWHKTNKSSKVLVIWAFEDFVVFRMSSYFTKKQYNAKIIKLILASTGAFEKVAVGKVCTRFWHNPQSHYSPRL